MASIRVLLTDVVELHREIKRRNDAAELERARKFIAARKLQAWFRGLATRKHLRMLQNSAITIQRHWRGFMARKFVKSYVKDQVKRMWWNHYHRCATKIQALWRGYKARKNGVNLPKYKKWLHSVYDKNAEALTKMKELRNSELFYTKNITEHNSLLWILFILFKLHHLLRTESQPGVLTRIDKTKFTVIEKMIRSLEYSRYMENRRREKCSQQQPEISPPLLKGTYFARCEKEIRELQESLEMGKASLRRGTPYDEKECHLKEVGKIREDLIYGKFGGKLPFRTVTRNNCKLPCVQDGTVRVTAGDYNPQRLGFTSIRPERDKSKELNGDFKTLVKPNELYEAINKMDCPLVHMKVKCPIHDFPN